MKNSDMEMDDVHQSTKGYEIIFIHSSVDDAQLTPAEFRVLAHVCRRAINKKKPDSHCYASARTMAEICQLHPDTVWNALAELERRHMLRRTPRLGTTTRWDVLPPDEWILEPIQTGQPENKGCPSKPGAYPPETEGCHPPGLKGCKGNPSKGNPSLSKEDPQPPEVVKVIPHPETTQSKKLPKPLTPFQIRVGSFFGRRPTTALSAKELAAFKLIPEPDPSDMEKLEAYYKHKWPADADYRRRDLITLLNNFSSELDRARKWKKPNCL